VSQHSVNSKPDTGGEVYQDPLLEQPDASTTLNPKQVPTGIPTRIPTNSNPTPCKA
jgi:hypothetical protein